MNATDSSPSKSAHPGIVKTAFKRLFDQLYPSLDWLFLFRPVIFIPIWTIIAAGLGAGRWLSTPSLFWVTSWNWWTLSLFIGATLIAGAAFIQAQLPIEGELQIKGYPSIIGQDGIPQKTALRISWIGLGAGLLLMLPAGWLALVSGIVLFFVWGMLYGQQPTFWKGQPVIETLLHLLAGCALFYMGWAASKAPLSASLNLAAPYILGFAAVSAMNALIPGPRSGGDARPGPVAITFTLALAAIMALVATIWGFKNGDPVIATTAVITLPFYAVALYYRRLNDLVRTNRYSLFIFVIFVGSRYPWLFVPVIIVFYLSRSYHRRRFGFVHPAFHVEGD